MISQSRKTKLVGRLLVASLCASFVALTTPAKAATATVQVGLRSPDAGSRVPDQAL